MAKFRVVIGAIIVASLVLAVGVIVGRFTSPALSIPSSTSAEAGFARDMYTHHSQAVEMSYIIRDRTDDADVRLLAYDIARTQAGQAGQMQGWLAVWGLPSTGPEPSMTWMSRPGLDGGDGHDMNMGDGETPAAMPGLATDEQLDELKSLSGVEAELYFLELMIAHHEGGVEMAEAVLDRSTEPVVVKLANGIVKSQTAEIKLMEAMIAQRS